MMRIIQGIKDNFIYINVSIVRILAGSQGKKKRDSASCRDFSLNGPRNGSRVRSKGGRVILANFFIKKAIKCRCTDLFSIFNKVYTQYYTRIYEYG